MKTVKIGTRVVLVKTPGDAGKIGPRSGWTGTVRITDEYGRAGVDFGKKFALGGHDLDVLKTTTGWYVDLAILRRAKPRKNPSPSKKKRA